MVAKNRGGRRVSDGADGRASRPKPSRPEPRDAGANGMTKGPSGTPTNGMAGRPHWEAGQTNGAVPRAAANGSTSKGIPTWDAARNGMSGGRSGWDASHAQRVQELENPHQRKLYDVIDEAPGLNINELAEEIGLSRSSTRYHLSRLMKEQLVVAHRQGHNRFHFSRAMPVMRRKAVFLLRLGTIRSLVDMTIEDRRLRTAETAEMLGISPRSVRRNLRLLEKEGLLECHPVRNHRGAYNVSFHPDLRVAWVLYCKDAGSSKMRPLTTAPAFLLGIELLFGALSLDWSS